MHRLRQRKLWIRLLAALLLLLGAAALIIFWPERADLSAYADLGDAFEVEILRDTFGVPHVFGQTDADAAFGLAYAHAEDDFLTIQQTLAAARGQLASIYGPDAAPNDYFVQLLRIWETMDARYETDITPETKALLDGYAAGLNYYGALHEAEVLPGLFPVSGIDVAAGFVHKTPLFFGLENVIGELFDEERARPVSGAGEAQAPNLGVSTRLSLPDWTYYGSNTLAVAPQRTADGGTYFAVNAHQPWQGPVTWYEAHVHSESGWDAAGGLFPGTPVILHGHNQDLSWAFTVNSPDLVDVYVLTINPDNPNQYWYDGQWLDLEVREAPIRVKLLGRLRWTVTEEALWSVYGPTVRRPHGTYAIRFAGAGEVTLVQQWYRLNRARTFADWRAAMADGPLPTFNVGYADSRGNIFYVYNALLPLRAEGYDWELYLPGDTSATLWTEYLPYDLLPQVENPASGFLQNANSAPWQTTRGPGNPDRADFSAVFGIEDRMSNRALRALEQFGADDAISWEAFVAYKYDVCYSADSDVPGFIATVLATPAAADATPLEQEARAALAAWDFCADADSRAATAGLLTLYFLDATPGAQINGSMLTASEVTEAMVGDAFQQALAHLETHFDGRLVPWGEVNRLRRGDLDLPLSGAPDTLHAVYGSFEEDGRLRANNGDSYVMLIHWLPGGGVRSYSIHQFGSATLDEDSPHFSDQSPLFAARELKPVWLTEADIRANLSRAYRPGRNDAPLPTGNSAPTNAVFPGENPMSDRTSWLNDELNALKEAGLFNTIRTIDSPMDAYVTIDGQRLLNFCANNYLGLANDPRVRQAAKDAIDRYGVGPGAVRTIAGTMSLHDELEERLAAFKKAEACITLQSGFTANLATIPAIVGKGDVIFSDELNHASIIDATRLSRAQVVRYAHNDVDDLRAKIAATTEYGRRLIVTDGVFSMDGDIAPLDKLADIADEHEIMLMVDDAHGEGVLGHGGRGIVDHFGLHGRVDIEVGTLSKAFGVVGGLVAGKQAIIDWLRQRGRPFLFSSAMTVPDAAACIEAVRILEESTELVDQLWDNARYFKQALAGLGFDIGHSTTPIVPVMLGEAPLARDFSRALFREGIFAMAIVYPTVPQGKARIRVMNSAAHNREDLDIALETFADVGKTLGVI